MLEFRNVSVSCQRTPILHDISVSFRAGEITAVIGPNGCGKTSLLQCLNGVSKVTAGTVLLNGRNYLSIPLRERARNVAFLPQVRTIIPAIPVKTLVEHGRFPYLGFARKKSEKDVAIVERAMELAHVTQFANQSVDTLSGGMRQRVFFAMTLAQDCDYIVLDEPTTYLDLSGQRDFFSMIRELKHRGKTVILVLHDLSQAIRIADKLVIMDRLAPSPGVSKAENAARGFGRIAGVGTPEECLKLHLIDDVFDTSWKRFSDPEGDYYFFQ